MAMKTMKAARYYQAGDVRIDEIPAPDAPAKGDHILLEVAYSGICGTDVHEYLGGPAFCTDSWKNASCSQEKGPCVLGHEFSGTIIKLGSDVNDKMFQVGDRVAIEPTFGCEECEHCKAGERNLCRKLGFIGLSGGGGGLSKFVSVPHRMAHVLPDNVSLEVGAMVEPLAVAWHAVRKGNVGKGDKVIVFGAGPIGCFIIKVLKAKGAGYIAVVEPTAKRSMLAKKSGANLVLNPANQNVAEECIKATGGKGCDIAFDAAGTEKTVQAAIDSVRAKGTIVNVAIWEKPVTISMNDLLLQEKYYMGVICCTPAFIDTLSSCDFCLQGLSPIDSGDHEDVLKALADGSIEAEDLITGRIKVDDVVKKGFEALIHQKDEHIKILVSPT